MKINYSRWDDNDLLRAFYQEKEGAFREIYHRYWNVLFSSAYHILQHKNLAQDAVQEVFLSLWKRRQETQIDALGPYLRTATRFQVLKAIRQQRVSARFYDRLAKITADIVYEQPLLHKEGEQLLAQALQHLPEDCLHIFKLSREEQFTYRQIAGQLNISEKTVEKKISLCLKHIRLTLQHDLGLATSWLLLLLSGQ
ncbi:MAG: RNA polymerase sigma-70 factor [Candidatus Pseudobacter hemicellulosilyticus]|uniref:RNA polymerase sigma-70 factor n=1 Tax=Candidatus Pseudobacter hemicellulosilyticus TaxID=3121375 RepID=A0AAJ5WTG7_9BACT|nr:MAG: RNA polymerase sigma-70 factor [Pseudobacter sp.]